MKCGDSNALATQLCRSSPRHWSMDFDIFKFKIELRMHVSVPRTAASLSFALQPSVPHAEDNRCSRCAGRIINQLISIMANKYRRVKLTFCLFTFAAPLGAISSTLGRILHGSCGCRSPTCQAAFSLFSNIYVCKTASCRNQCNWPNIHFELKRTESIGNCL